jgi:hypothetical protein
VRTYSPASTTSLHSSGSTVRWPCHWPVGYATRSAMAWTSPALPRPMHHAPDFSPLAALRCAGLHPRLQAPT